MPKSTKLEFLRMLLTSWVEFHSYIFRVNTFLTWLKIYTFSQHHTISIADICHCRSHYLSLCQSTKPHLGIGLVGRNGGCTMQGLMSEYFMKCCVAEAGPQRSSWPPRTRRATRKGWNRCELNRTDPFYLNMIARRNSLGLFHVSSTPVSR